jgi:hypothetical protein
LSLVHLKLYDLQNSLLLYVLNRIIVPSRGIPSKASIDVRLLAPLFAEVVAASALLVVDEGVEVMCELVEAIAIVVGDEPYEEEADVVLVEVVSDTATVAFFGCTIAISIFEILLAYPGKAGKF